MTKLVPLDPESQLGYQLVRVADQVSRIWHRALRTHNINPRQFSVLALLAHDPGLSQGELARRVMVTPQSMSELLVSLRDDGLIKRDAPAPGRAAQVQLTASGRRLLGKAYPVVEESNSEAFAVLSDTEYAELARICKKLLSQPPRTLT